MRWVIARVLPVPAPAKIRTGPDRVVAAGRCSASRPARISSGVCNLILESAGLRQWPAVPVAHELVCDRGGPRDEHPTGFHVESGRMFIPGAASIAHHLMRHW